MKSHDDRTPSQLWVWRFLHLVIPDVKVYMGSRLGGSVQDVLL
jgi:hypothetical protein